MVGMSHLSGDEPEDIFYSFYGVDPEVYHVTKLPDPITVVNPDEVTPSKQRGKNDAAIFYSAQFECGLRLPLDPFIVSFLEHNRILPCDLPPNSVRMLVCFAVIARVMGYEPTIEASTCGLPPKSP